MASKKILIERTCVPVQGSLKISVQLATMTSLQYPWSFYEILSLDRYFLRGRRYRPDHIELEIQIPSCG